MHVPVGIRVDGRDVLVVGAGRIAARKAAVYVNAGAKVTVVAPKHGPEMEQLTVHCRARRAFTASDLDGVWLAVTATGEPSVDGAVFAAAEERRVWCNAADDPQHCSVILPAVARADDITVAVSTGGRSPAVASWIRRRVVALLDHDTLAVADVAATVRAEARRRGQRTEVDGWAQVLDSEALGLVADGEGPVLAERLAAVIAAGQR